MVEIICSTNGKTMQPLDWQCAESESPLDLKGLPIFNPDAIIEDDFSIWRYQAMLPVEKRFTLGEGMTPLVPTEIDGTPFHAKLEYLNPTGSYKDRGTAVMMNHIAAQGVTEVVEDSSGNAGASVAAYSSVAGIHARIYVPATGSPAKKGLIKAFGAELMEIEGEQHAKTLACLEAAKTTTYASHAWSPFFVLGQTTVGWEVWEQLGRRAPDAIVTPLGHGGLFLGFWRGFKALYEAGLIDKLPQMFAVQSAGCDPIVQAVEQDLEETPPVTPTYTVADGIIVEIPVRGKEVLQAIRESNGSAIRVDNEAILAAQAKLSRKGMIVEPTSSVSVAALEVIRSKIEADNPTLVVALTGNGLKNVGSL